MTPAVRSVKVIDPNGTWLIDHGPLRGLQVGNEIYGRSTVEVAGPVSPMACVPRLQVESVEEARAKRRGGIPTYTLEDGQTSEMVDWRVGQTGFSSKQPRQVSSSVARRCCGAAILFGGRHQRVTLLLNSIRFIEQFRDIEFGLLVRSVGWGGPAGGLQQGLLLGTRDIQLDRTSTSGCSLITTS